ARRRGREVRPMNTKFEQWSAHARTPETRTRIRRLAVLERIFHVLGVVEPIGSGRVSECR
ncbi:hypothetical protein NOU13_23495, partial [Rhodococcus erythropolis]|nr:hypothetical protein [Rhodococcus erythropolis]